MRILMSFLIVLLSSRVVEAESFLYVSVAGEKRIAIYQRDEKTGKLTHAGDVSTTGEPGALTTDPRREFLFASLRSTGELTSFRIDPKTGGLESLSHVAAGADPAFVATDRTGRFLLSAYYRAGKAEVHQIEYGRLSKAALFSVPTDEKAHAILTDRSNQFAFVPHTGPNAIFQFRFDETTGKLVTNSPAKVQTGENTGPRHLAFHPKLNIVYFDNEQGSSVTAYRMNPQTGTLAAFQTLSTLPAGFTENNSCARLEISPDGKFLYAANRGHDSLAGYRVDEQAGKLTAIGQFSTEDTPRSFSISPDGKHLYAAGQSSGKLAAYRIDPKTGTLDRFATYRVGDRPWWVLAVSLPRDRSYEN